MTKTACFLAIAYASFGFVPFSLAQDRQELSAPSIKNINEGAVPSRNLFSEGTEKEIQQGSTELLTENKEQTEETLASPAPGVEQISPLEQSPVSFRQWLAAHPLSMTETTRSTGPVTAINPGFTFDAVLVTSILSFNTITPVIAETEYDILYLGQVVFPKGTRIIGTSNLIKTLDRVNVQFHTIVYPNGRWIPFAGLALHTDGSGGVPGKVKKEKSAVPARILLQTAGAATAVATQQPLAGQMVAGIAEETGKEIQEKQTFSITIRKGIPIMVYIANEILF